MPPPRPSAPASDGTQRPLARLVSRIFATRLGTLIAFPGLVLLVGICFVVLGQSSLGTSIAASSGGRTLDLADGFARNGETWTTGVELLLDELAGQAVAHPDDPGLGLAQLGGLLLRGHPEVEQAGIVLPDGSAWRLTRQDGAIRATRHTRWQPDADADGRTTWFTAASATDAVDGDTHWSAPDAVDGATRRMRCAQAARDPASGTLVAVVYAHLDLDAIDARMRALTVPIGFARPAGSGAGGEGGTGGADRDPHPARTAPAGADAPHGPRVVALLFDGAGRLVAASRDPADPARLAAVLAAVAPLVAAGSVAAPPAISGDHAAHPLLHTVTIPGDDSADYVVAIRHLDGTDLAGWQEVAVMRTDRTSGPAQAHLRRSLQVGLVVLVLAVALSLLLAQHLARQRRLVSVAQTEADSVVERLRSLGSYRLVRKLGEGGMGTVWLAEHELLARPTAVKVILPEALGTTAASRERALERFAREAKVTASLRSRHTVTLYDYGVSDGGAFYYAMELLDGMDLDSLIRHDGAQPAARVIAILSQACRSLAEAHARGLVHRDIKPANLFLCRPGAEVDEVKVLDFGLVTTTTDLSDGPRVESVQGTPAFMSPEQACGRPVDARSDLYALGCVGYCLLSGHDPFAGHDPQTVMAAHVTQQPAPLTVTAPPALLDLIHALMAKDPAHRPASAAAVQATLAAIATASHTTWTEADALAWWGAQPTAEALPPAAAGHSTASSSRLLLARSAMAGITVGQSIGG